MERVYRKKIDISKRVARRDEYHSIGERIRHMRDTGVMDFIPTPACYDDEPNHPSKSMDVDPSKQLHQEPFDVAERIGKYAFKAQATQNQQAGSAPDTNIDA